MPVRLNFKKQMSKSKIPMQIPVSSFKMFGVLDIDLCVHLDIAVSPRRIITVFTFDHQVPDIEGTCLL